MAYADELEWYIELAIAIGCLLFAVLATFIVCYCFCTGSRRESAVVVDGSATGSYHLLMGGVGVGGGNDHDGTTRDVGGATTSVLGLSSSHPLGDDGFPTATGVGARISAGTGDGSFVQRPPTREGGLDGVNNNNNSNNNYNINSDSTRSGRKPFLNRSSSFVSSRPPLSSSESTGSLASASRRASAVSFIQPQQRSGHNQHQNSSNLSSSSSDLVGGMVGDSHGERREGDGRANNGPQSTSVNTAAATDNGGLPFRHQLESRGQHFGSVDGFDEL